MDGLPIRIEGLLVKREATYDVDPTPTLPTNAVQVVGRIWTAVPSQYEYPNDRDDVVSGSVFPVGPGPRRGRFVPFEFVLELKGPGAAYSASVLPPADPFLFGSGFGAPVIVDNTSETYTLGSSLDGSFTLWAYSGGKLYKLTGCRANPIFMVDAGELVRARFVGRGRLTSVATVALPATLADGSAYGAVAPLPATGLAFTIGAWAPDEFGLEVDGGCELVTVRSGNAADGIAGFRIVRCVPTARVTALAPVIATYDPDADMATTPPTARALGLSVGATQYNRFDLDIANADLTAPRPIEQDGLTGYELAYRGRNLVLAFL
jgi:hypothetical protein